MDRMPVEGLEQFGIPRACIEKLKQRDIVTLQGVQVKAIEAGLFDRTDLVISAPTTSGKTLIAELALLKHSIEAKGCFFLVSHKALAEEKYMHFRANYADPTKPWFKVAVSTGDRTQFDEELADYQIIVATYEKLYGLLNANPSMADWISLVVIDELQTLGDPARGATLESLVTKMKQLNGSIQIIALSATVPNVQEMARWLKAQACISTTRPVPLEEWIWSKNRFLSKRFGSKAIEEQSPLSVELDTFSVVDHHAGQGDIPVLVFAITRSRTQDLARELAAPRSIRRDMQRYVDEVSAVTENTPASRVLIEVMRKGIGFHTADLSFAEKEIVERAFREGALDIVVATTTLAAGINTPAKTVIFDSIYRHWLHDYIGVEEYVNMSGRAGRMGYSETGKSILIAKNESQVERFRRSYLRADLQRINSVFGESPHLDFHILHLISSGHCQSADEVIAFFNDSYYIFQWNRRDPNIAGQLPQAASKAIDSLISDNLVTVAGGRRLTATPFGRCCSQQTILPTTALQLKGVVLKFKGIFTSSSVEAQALSILYEACNTEEVNNRYGLLFEQGNEAVSLYAQAEALGFPDSLDTRAFKTALMLQDWINGGTYTQLRNKFNASYGQTQRAADNVSWMIESMAEIGKLPEVGLDEQAVLSLRLLSRRVKFGVPVNAVEIMEIAKSQFLTNKGIGRSIAMKLAQSGIASVDDLLEVRMNDLAKIAGSEKAQVIKEGVLSFVEEYDIRRHRLRHSARAEKIGGNVHAVEELYDLYDDAFNRPVCTLLKSIGLDAKEKDTGAQPGDPDILIQTELGNICLECKTTRREEGSISLRKAQEVFGKSKGYDPVAMVTVGKPRFSPVATEKLAGSITLITCAALAEMVLQVWEGRLGKEAVLSHLMSKRHIGVEDL